MGKRLIISADLSLRIVDDNTLEKLHSGAVTQPRRRQHLNLHEDYGEPFQRLLNAIEPTSYIRPHRHVLDPKPECLIALRGTLEILLFDAAGRVARRQPLGATCQIYLVEIPAGAWHTVVSHSSGAVIFEAKAGPFLPHAAKEPAPWAPEEGTPEAASYLRHLHDL